MTFGVIDETGALLFKMDAYPFSLYSEGFIVPSLKKDKKTMDFIAGFIDRKGNWFPLPSKVGSHAIAGWSSIQDGIIRVRVKNELNKSNPYLYGDKMGYLKVTKNGGGI